MPLFRVQSQSLRAREIPRGGEGGRQFKNEAISEGMGVGLGLDVRVMNAGSTSEFINTF